MSSAVLLRDIDTRQPVGSSPYHFTTAGDVTFFKAADPTGGVELWRTDGVSAALVKDIVPGSRSSAFDADEPMAVVNGVLYLSVRGADGGGELWRSDGTAAGTVRVTRFADLPNRLATQPTSLAASGGVLYFTVDPNNGSNTGKELWRSDGTEAGTYLVKDIRAGAGSSEPRGMTDVNGTLYFSADDGSAGRELWKSDGTAAGTVRVKDLSAGSGSADPVQFKNVNGRLFFVTAAAGFGRGLWTSDGTAGGTVQLKGFDSFGQYPPAHLTDVNGTLYFAAHETGSPSNGAVWKSDGTAGGTVQVTPGFSRVAPSGLIAYNGALLFTSGSVGGNGELWRSDGTVNGTTRLRAFRGPSPVTGLTRVGDTVFFTAGQGDSFNGVPDTGAELFKTDGTAAGTVLVKDVQPGAAGSIGQSGARIALGAAGGRLVFAADNGGGSELFASDGTAGGTHVVADIYAATQSADVTPLARVGDTVYFRYGEPGTGLSSLWATDGTTAGTARASTVGPAAFDPAAVLGGALLFARGELYRSDAGGTAVLKDVRPGTAASVPERLKRVGDVVYFTADDGTGGRELWKTDGTADGTVLVKDIRPGSAGSDPSALTDVGGTLYFVANDGTHGFELWKSDGTETGTVMVEDARPGTGNTFGSPADGAVVASNGLAFFPGPLAAGGPGLWRSDGTEAGTYPVRDAYPGATQFNPLGMTDVNGTLYFVGDDGTHGRELWRSDGTPDGTAMVADLRPGAAGALHSTFNRLAAVGGTLFFAADDGSTGVELWKVDGPGAAPVRLRDINAGPSGSEISNLTAVGGGTLYFAAYDEAHGLELWASDGTEAGTALVQDLYPGPAGSAPQSLLDAGGGTLYFSAVDMGAGRELWRTDAGPAPADPYTVTTTADVGPGSLRNAMIAAAAAAGPQTVRFDLPPADDGDGSAAGGVRTITPQTPLPELIGPDALDATTQPGYAGAPLVEIDGSIAAAAGPPGVRIDGPGGAAVRGLIVNRFTAGVRIRGAGGNTVQGNYLGTDAAGTAARGNGYGVHVDNSPNNLIGGTTAAERNVVSGNNGHGVYVEGLSATGNRVRGNYVGTDASGSADLGNAGSGVYLNGAPANTVGGTDAGAGNVISGNDDVGAHFHTFDSVLQGNYIGTDAAGLAAIGNGRGGSGGGGVLLKVRDNTVGGDTPAARNVISGNAGDGVLIDWLGNAADTSRGHRVWGNYIGTDATGAAALPNRGWGVRAGSRSSDVTIGGAEPGRRNVISANTSGGVYLEGPAFSAGVGNFRVTGNYIGTDAAGARAFTATIAGGGQGVRVSNTPAVVVGGAAAGEGNVIAGHGVGVLVEGAAASGTRVLGNRIGTDAAGAAPLPNNTGVETGSDAADVRIGGAAPGEGNVIAAGRNQGVRLGGSGGRLLGNWIGTNPAGDTGLGNLDGVVISNRGNTLVGGAEPGAANTIAHNQRSGVFVSGSTGNRVTRNAIHSNGLLGIDLFSSGLYPAPAPEGNVTPNDRYGDSDFGPNLLQNTPTLDAAAAGVTRAPEGDGGGPVARTHAAGALETDPGRVYTIEFFASAEPDPTGYGEGQTYLGSIDVRTDGAGRAEFAAAFDGDLAGRWLSATATDAGGNTSEFSRAVPVTAGSVVGGRRVFYNNSRYDGGDPAAGAADDGAVAPGKQALRPGQTATPANYTAYSRGINGVMVDLAGLPFGAAPLTAGDFVLKTGNTPDPAGWSAAPDPESIDVRRGAGIGGSDRVTIVWADGAIRNTWLQVSVLSNDHTGLAAPDVFYFGNAVGETFDSATAFRVDSRDVTRTRNAQGKPTSVWGLYDHNRDGRVNTSDLTLARNNQTFALARLAAPAANAVTPAGTSATAAGTTTTKAAADTTEPVVPPSKSAASRKSRGATQSLLGEDGKAGNTAAR